ncbi:MAG: hypothetical protein M1827_007600 [Pycnora praestabilis]|nr:MAG: hypothetical protein M1827_007600 [Pycnora praestabilis]
MAENAGLTSCSPVPISSTETSRSSSPEGFAEPSKKHWRKRLGPFACGLVAVLINLGNQLTLVPFIRFLELGVCREYYVHNDPSVVGPDGDVAERLCKNAPMQTKVAYLFGTVTLLTVICELIVTIPFGCVSDKFGRKIVLYFNTVATILYYGWVLIVGHFYQVFKIEAVIAGPFFYVFGGHLVVSSTTLFVIMADFADDDVQRTKMFGYLASAKHLMNLISPILASAALRRDLRLPFWLGIIVLVLTLPAIALLPDTRRHPTEPTENGHANGIHAVDEEREPSEASPLLNEQPAADQQVEPPSGILHYLHMAKDQMKSDYHDFMFLFSHSRNVSLCLIVFVGLTLVKANLGVLIQFVSVRYGWVLDQAVYFFSMKAGINIILYTLIIPLILSYLINHRNYAKVEANLWGAKASLVLLSIGVLAISVSVKIWMFIPALAIYSLGWGLSLFTLSLLTHASFETLDDRHTGRIYSAVGFVESFGSLIGVPLISAIWAGAINLGGIGLGLPYLVCAVIYFGVGYAIWSLNFRSTTRDVQDVEG